MATLSTNSPTLLDVARSLDPQGKIANIALVLQEYNDILEDINWTEGNLPTGHQSNVETSKPTPNFRLLNQGVVPSKATAGIIVDTCAILEDRNEIDINIAKLNGNTEGFRRQQDRSFIQGFSDQLATSLIYGDVSVNPEQFNGLASRYFSLGTTYTTSANMIDGGGTGSDNTSIWLVNWSPSTVFGIYPKGSKAGMQFEDLGIQDVLTDSATGAKMRAYTSWFQWLCGMAISDWRHVVRICNVDISDLETSSDGTDNSANILKFMSQAIDLLPPNGMGRPVFYMNNRVRSMLRVKLLDKSNFYLQTRDVMGAGDIARKQLEFYGVPCRRVDAITNTEAQITTATT